MEYDRKLIQATVSVGFLILFLLSGCELTSDPPNFYRPPTANNLIINEVFSLSPQNPNAFTWIEIYNPTPARIRWVEQDSLSPTRFLRKTLFIKLRAVRSIFNIFGPNPTPSTIDTGYVYIASYLPRFYPSSVSPILSFILPFSSFARDSVIAPSGFALVVSDTVKFRNHFNLGPGNGKMSFLPFGVVPDTLVTVTIRLDSSRTFTFKDFPRVGFAILPSNEIQLVIRTDTVEVIVLPDSSRALNGIFPEREEVLDVVRYGNFNPLTPDPFPNNLSAGVIPEWTSLARFAGGYFTGNTRRDFYVEPTPTPLWVNPRHGP